MTVELLSKQGWAKPALPSEWVVAQAEPPNSCRWNPPAPAQAGVAGDELPSGQAWAETGFPDCAACLPGPGRMPEAPEPAHVSDTVRKQQKRHRPETHRGRWGPAGFSSTCRRSAWPPWSLQATEEQLCLAGSFCQGLCFAGPKRRPKCGLKNPKGPFIGCTVQRTEKKKVFLNTKLRQLNRKHSATTTTPLQQQTYKQERLAAYLN